MQDIIRRHPPVQGTTESALFLPEIAQLKALAMTELSTVNGTYGLFIPMRVVS